MAGAMDGKNHLLVRGSATNRHEFLVYCQLSQTEVIVYGA